MSVRGLVTSAEMHEVHLDRLGEVLVVSGVDVVNRVGPCDGVGHRHQNLLRRVDGPFCLRDDGTEEVEPADSSLLDLGAELVMAYVSLQSDLRMALPWELKYDARLERGR